MSFTASLTEIVHRNANGLLGKHDSWGRVRLHEIASILNGFAFASAFFTKDKGLPLMRIRDILSDTTEAFYSGEYDPTYLINAGELVIGMDGDFNCALWKGGPALLNQRVCKITVKENLYSLRFLAYALPGYLAEINKETSSVTVKHLSSNTIGQIPLPLPPLPEQHRIVAKIEELFTKLDAGVEALRTARAQLGRYRQAVLKAAVTGELTREWREAHRGELEPASELLARILRERREKWEADQLAKMKAAGKTPKNDEWKEKYAEPNMPSAESLPELPKSWVSMKLAALADLKGGITKGQRRRADEVLRSVPYLRVANVQRGYLDLSEIKHIEATDGEINELRLIEGDILFNEGGDRDKLGRGWVWHNEIPECIHQNHVFRARLYNSDVQPKFVSWFGNTFGQQYFIDEGKQTTNLASINLTKLSALPVPLPPAKEQEHIIEELERLLSIAEATERAIGQGLKHAERLRQSILKQAFEGKLVPQDPADEPAEVLLARIRGEREGRAAARPKNPKPRRAPRRASPAGPKLFP